MNIVVVTLVMLALSAGGAILLKRSLMRRARRTSETDGAELRARLVDHFERKGEKVTGGLRGPRNPRNGEEAAARVTRVRDAVANGDIDDRMVGTAARMIGISKEEARRRLEKAGDTVTPPGAVKKPVDREKRRKKKQQAKRSKRANRR
jgi:cell division GTPase FtsZ